MSFFFGKTSLLFGFSLGCAYKIARCAHQDAGIVTRAGDNAHEQYQKEQGRGLPITQGFRNYRLGETINLAADVALFRFLLPHIDDEFFLQPCSTLMATWYTGGASAIDRVERFYTPITPNHTKGYFDILVKKQRAGRMTEKLFSMAAGDSLMFRSIQCKLKYTANAWKEVGLVGGGTGITPLLQVIRTALEDENDRTKLTLIYGNRSPEKILLKGCLDQLQRDHPERFKIVYVCDDIDSATCPPDFKGYKGHINPEILQKHLPAPSHSNKVLVCGPDKMMMALCGVPPMVAKSWSGSNPRQPSAVGMMNHTFLTGYLGDLGYKTEEVFRF